ncbi:MAG TPA: hypothetical protein VK766_00360 [Cytophagaceae bacterium]|jgi:hypothetical protein|nr:hypothetical protein [Cytophagaceae bacterium]
MEVRLNIEKTISSDYELQPFKSLDMLYTSLQKPFAIELNEFASCNIPYESLKDSFAGIYLDYSGLTPYRCLDKGFDSVLY